MPSRTPGGQPDPAAELLGRWQAHHDGRPESSGDDQTTEEPSASGADPTPGSADETTDDTPDEATVLPDATEAPEAAPATDAPDPGDVEPAPAPSVTPSVVPAADDAPRHAASRPLSERPLSPRGFDQTTAGREVVEALGIPAPPKTPAQREPAPRPAERRRPVAPGHASPTPSTDVEFPPRVVARRLLGLMLLVLVPACVAAGFVAYRDPKTLTLGVTGTLVVLTLVLYGLRVGSAPVRLSIHSGQLEVVRGSSREVFDLTSRFTRLEVVGRPGRPGWKVLMARFGRDPLVIDSSMVDPAAFTAALERHRPRS